MTSDIGRSMTKELLEQSLPDRIRLLMKLRNAGVKDTRVLSAMEFVPRELFVPEAFQDKAYEDTALPIDADQTISQPSVVALMSEALEVSDRMRVLEIGTGSGYQTVILSRLCRMVYTIERHKSLLHVAEERFKFLGLTNIITHAGDGSKGWKKAAPFDRIMVTAAAAVAPVHLIEQMAEGGIMIVPLGGAQDQSLMRLTKKDGKLSEEHLADVRFVPLVEGKIVK